MSVFSKIKKWLTKKPKDDKIKEANRVTNYGGGASSKSVQKEVKRSIVKAEAKKRGEKQTEYQKSAVSKSSNSAFKAMPPSAKKAEAKDKKTSKKSDPFNAKNAFKASAQPKFSHQSTALGTMSTRDINSRIAKRNAADINQKYRSRAADKLKPLIDEKYSGDTAESKRRIKSGEYQSDPNVMKYETLKHPIAMSAGRGALSGATFGLSELGIALLPKRKEVEEAERLYQANKSKGAEFAGEMAGSLLGFGLTSGASKTAVTKLAPKTTARLGESATEYLAKNGLVRRAAEKEALRKLGTTATKEEIEHFAKARAAKLVAALGEDAAINLTTGAVSDVSHAIVESDNPAEFLKNMGISAAGNVVLGGVTSAAPLFRNGADSGLERVFAGDVFNRANRANIDEGLERINIRDMARPSAQNIDAQVDDAIDAVAEPPKAQSKRKKTPPTREERLANSNGIDQYNARAEHQAQRFEEGYEKADNIRAALGGEEPKAPAKGAKPAAETLTTKAEASAPKTATKKEPRVIEDVGEVVHKRKAKVTRREKIKEFTESVRTKISDSLSAFEDEARKKSRDEMLDDYGAADKVRRHQTIANRSVIEHQQQWNGKRFSGEVTRNGHTFENGKSLKQIYDGMDEATEKDFDSYLLLKHAPDRIKEGKPIFDNTILKNGDSLNDPEVCRREAQKLLEKHPEFEAKAEEIYQYTQNELQNRVDAGLLSQDVADKWMKDHPFYVPTGRDMDEDFSVVYDSAVTGAQGLKAARGGDQAIRSVRDQLEYATTRNWRDMSMNNLFRRTFGEDIANELAKEADGGIEKVLDNTIDLHAGKDGKFYANVFVDGEKKSIEIEKKFYDAVQDLYKNGRLGNGIDVLNDAASIPAGVFKNLITEYSPIFMIKNFMRDFPEAFINTRQTKEFVESMLPALKDLATGGEYTQALKDAGISQSTFIDFDKALKSGKGKKNLFAIGNEYTELFPRLVEYMATFKKAGVSLKDADMALRDRAAANAADVTVNFGRSGSVGKMLNKGFVPFFNPSVQGWSKFARNLTELRHADAKTALSFVLKATALGAGARTINNFMLQDNPNYQNISARDKANNYIFPLGDAKKTDKFLKIPSSRFAAVYGLPSVNAFNENKMGWAEAFKVAKDQVTPIDPLESNVFSQALQIKNNQTWYGTPIVPKALEDLPKSEQYDVNTSWFGKQLGKATENLPKELQISPKKADYAIDALTGVIGDFALPASTPSKRGNSIGESIRKTAARQFTIDTVTQNNLSTRFYDKLQEANTNNQSSKGGKAEADEYKRLNGFSTEISKVNAAIKDLQGSKRETKLDDVRGMQKFRNQLMQDALDGNDAPSSNKTMNTVQKYAGTTYAINHFGKQVDKDAMKNYGKKKYGDISNAEMRKAINEDKGFFKGVKAIGNLEERIVKAGTTSNTTLTKAVALAGANADDDLFGAYGAIYKSRTETANKMTRARNYFKEGGSEKEYTKLELARRTLGKLPDDQKKSELDKLEKQLAKGEVDWAERDAREKSIEYNANISYLGLAASLAQANAPARGYRLYDIKDKNIQKGINLAAMGFTARDYKEMSKALDTNGNGYPSKQEIIDYVENSGFKDKATLFDALYYYQGKSNPFGTPTKYTREQAALMGKKNGVKAISGESEDIKLNPDEGSSNGYRGYYRGGYRRWHSWGGSRSRKGRQPISANNSAFKAKKANISGSSSPKMSVSGASNISRTSARVSSNPKIDITPLNVKAVKSAKTGRTSSNLSAALEDIQRTEKKVKPPKARR